MRSQIHFGSRSAPPPPSGACQGAQQAPTLLAAGSADAPPGRRKVLSPPSLNGSVRLRGRSSPRPRRSTLSRRIPPGSSHAGAHAIELATASVLRHSPCASPQPMCFAARHVVARSMGCPLPIWTLELLGCIWAWHALGLMRPMGPTRAMFSPGCTAHEVAIFRGHGVAGGRRSPPTTGSPQLMWGRLSPLVVAVSKRAGSELYTGVSATSGGIGAPPWIDSAFPRAASASSRRSSHAGSSGESMCSRRTAAPRSQGQECARTRSSTFAARHCSQASALHYVVGDLCDAAAVDSVVQGADCMWHIGRCVGMRSNHHQAELRAETRET